MAVFVDGEVRLSMIRAIYVDKLQKKWLPSTYKLYFMDRATGPSTPESLFMDESRKKPVASTIMAVHVDGKESDCMQYT